MNRSANSSSAWVVTPGVITTFENAVSMIPHTTSFMRRNTCASSGSLVAITSTASASTRFWREDHAGPSAACIPSISPALRPSLKAHVRETLNVIAVGLRCSMTSFSTCHCSSPQSSACTSPRAPAGPAAGFVERTARKTPPCEAPPSAMRSTPQALPGCAVTQVSWKT